MNKPENNSVRDAIKAFLDNKAQNDELFAKIYAKENKNIDECFEYIVGEAKKRGNAVYMSDKEVFGMAVHYYDEDSIKIEKLPSNVKVSTSSSKSSNNEVGRSTTVIKKPVIDDMPTLFNFD